MDPPTNTTCQEYHWDGRPPWLCWSPLLGEQESGGGGVLVLFCTHFLEMARKHGRLGELWLEWTLQPLQHVRSTTGMAAHHGCVGLLSLVSKKVVGVVFSCYFARTFSKWQGNMVPFVNSGWNGPSNHCNMSGVPLGWPPTMAVLVSSLW